MSTFPKPRLVKIQPQTLHEWMRTEEVLLVDVREADEFEEEHILGSIAMPLSKFDPNQVPAEPGKKTILTCFIGGRSAQAADKLFAAGHDEVMHLDAGIFGWKEVGYQTEQGRSGPSDKT
jgi:rhodanese-related sulfurtransferase